MEYLRQMVDSDALSAIFNLPRSLRHKRVEVIIRPAEGESAGKSKNGNSFGCLKEYAKPALIAQEKDAWLQAAVKKEGIR